LRRRKLRRLRRRNRLRRRQRRMRRKLKKISRRYKPRRPRRRRRNRRKGRKGRKIPRRSKRRRRILKLLRRRPIIGKNTGTPRYLRRRRPRPRRFIQYHVGPKGPWSTIRYTRRRAFRAVYKFKWRTFKVTRGIVRVNLGTRKRRKWKPVRRVGLRYGINIRYIKQNNAGESQRRGHI
jgi:hypothetical protein